ncbi:hypothetical protein AB4140_16810 [Shewanella sp. 10N.286.51.B2]|uniref:hypothetical protein n=1 Tax=Shewanella sp. 10N.286.51.B2 TaxID=3229707 RepID=UPI00354F6F58
MMKKMDTTSSIMSDQINTEDYRLAIVDKDGQVIWQGHVVKQTIFDAMTNQVIRQFCKRFNAFNKEDFR